MQRTDVERVTHPSREAAYATLAAHQSAGGTSRIVPVENGRWVAVVGAPQSRLLTTAGRLITPAHCLSCGSPDRLRGRCFNCEEWEWL